MREFLRRNKVLAVILVVLLALYVLITTTSDADASVRGQGQEKIQVCHLEGNGTSHLIEVAEPAVQAHIDHGDVLATDGVCPSPEPEPQPDPSVWSAWELVGDSEPIAGEPAFRGGDQLFYAEAETKAALIAQLGGTCVSYQLDKTLKSVLDAAKPTLSRTEFHGKTHAYDFYTTSGCEQPPVDIPEEPETPPAPPAPPVTPETPSTPSTPDIVNPGSVTGGTPESVQALPAEQREFVEQFARERGIAPEDVLIEMG